MQKALVRMHSLAVCMNNKGMRNIMTLPLLMFVVAAYNDSIHILGPDRVQEFHACVGTSAYIPWPLNVISRTGHRSTVINLIFQRRHSEKALLVATLSGQRELKAESHFKDRLSISSENSGVFLDRVTMDDAGTYFAQAHISNGQVWTRATNLTVHLRPIVYNGRLNVTQSDVVHHSSRNVHCVNITCGTLEYAGYPPAKFVWTAQSKTLSTKVATDDSATSVQICSPYFGDVTCSIAGFSSVCTYDHISTLHLDLPGPRINTTIVLKTATTQDLVLTIVMPILAVLVPLAALGMWLLRHILKSYPQYREQQHCQHQEGQAAVDIDDNIVVEQAHDNDEDSEVDVAQTDIKEDAYDTDEDNAYSGMEGSNTEYHHDRAGNYDDDGNRVEDVNDSEENDGNKVNEELPLMDDPGNT